MKTNKDIEQTLVEQKFVQIAHDINVIDDDIICCFRKSPEESSKAELLKLQVKIKKNLKFLENVVKDLDSLVADYPTEVCRISDLIVQIRNHAQSTHSDLILARDMIPLLVMTKDMGI